MARRVEKLSYRTFPGYFLESGKGDVHFAAAMQNQVARTVGGDIAELIKNGWIELADPIFISIGEAIAQEIRMQPVDQFKPQWNPYDLGDRTVVIKISYTDKRSNAELERELAEGRDMQKSLPGRIAIRPDSHSLPTMYRPEIGL